MKYQINTQSKEELDIYVAAIEKFGIKNLNNSSYTRYDEYPSLLIRLDDNSPTCNYSVVQCIPDYYLLHWGENCRLTNFSSLIKLLTNKRSIKIKLDERVDLEYNAGKVNIGILQFSPEPFIEFGKQLDKIMH